jgi:putative ABC transport system permease protein
MTDATKTIRFRFWLWLIRIVGVIVPRRLRADWRQEWEAELRHREELLAEWDRLDWRNKVGLLWRSTSAFWDALWLQPKRMEDEMFQDLRYGLRMLRTHKGFTIVAILSLALGIGANTAIFSLIDALMLKMLPVKDARELALFAVVGREGALNYYLSYPLYEMFRDRNRSFAGIITTGGVRQARLTVNEPGGGSVVESVQQQDVSGNFFSVLGVNAVLGRTLSEVDDDPANPQPAAVISYGFWQRRFGLDPGVVGRQVTLNNTALTIVGIAPPGFFGTEVGARAELWWPTRITNHPGLKDNSAWTNQVIGRLRPGVSLAQAQAEMDAIYRQQLEEIAGARGANWASTQRQKHFESRLRLEAGGAGWTELRQQFKRPLFILMMTIALVLLIACVNVANLLLARSASRRKEIAMRLALGAGRFRLVRQLLTESLLLAIISGVTGLLFARLGVRVLLVYLPRQTQLDVSLDSRVLTFTLAVSILTGLLFGLAPAWQATRLDLTASLKDRAGASADRSRLALNKLLVVMQVALSLFLLIGAGLFVRSLRNLRTLDAGINYENIVQFRIDPGGGYNAERYRGMQRQLIARLETLPGVHSATLSIPSLLSGDLVAFGVTVPGYVPRADEDLSCNIVTVGPRFFENMKIPLLAGRDFGSQDERPVSPGDQPFSKGVEPQPNLAAAPPLSAIINQAMASHFFGQQNPIGKRFISKRNGQVHEIIGVVKDSKYRNLREVMPRIFYTYQFQQMSRSGGGMYQLRTNVDAADFAATIQRIVREQDPQLRVFNLRTMREVVDDSLVQERFVAEIASAFSLFALLLTCVGLYGVMSYMVTRRTNEIGIRMALGARKADVVRLVMREVLLLVVVGAVIGLAAALGTTQFVATLLYGLTPNDPVTIALATLLLLGVAALAGYLPARRATMVDPLVALRCE